MDNRSRWEQREALDELIATWTATQPSAASAAAALAAAGVPSSRVTSPGALLDDLQLLATEYIHYQDHPSIGHKRIGGAPWTMDGERPRLERAPLLGEHTDQIRRLAAALAAG